MTRGACSAHFCNRRAAEAVGMIQAGALNEKVETGGVPWSSQAEIITMVQTPLGASFHQWNCVWTRSACWQRVGSCPFATGGAEGKAPCFFLSSSFDMEISA